MAEETIVERKLDRVLEILEDMFLSPEELRDVLYVKKLYYEGRLGEETVDAEEVLRKVQQKRGA